MTKHKRPHLLDPSIGIEFIKAGDVTFEVYTCGQGDRLALCLHGFPELAYSWRHQLPHLASLGYRVWAPNMRGYGHSDRPHGVDAYHFDDLLQDIANLIDASGAKEVVLIAHDWGAILAWAFAIRKIRPLSKLIILNIPHPALFMKHVYHWPQIAKSWYMFFFQIPWLPDTLLRAFNAKGIELSMRAMAIETAPIETDVIQVYRDAASKPYAVTAMLNYYRGLFRRQGGLGADAKGQIPMIETPTLMIWAEANKALGLELTEGTETYVKDFTLRVLPNVSHWVQQEAPNRVNLVIESWLHEQPIPVFI